MAVARDDRGEWAIEVQPVGPVETLFSRLRAIRPGTPIALGVDFPIGLPREYAALHAGQWESFPDFLRGLAERTSFFDVAETLAEVHAGRPFYPRRGIRGMTRVSHAEALGLGSAAGLSRACDRKTADRPAGAPVFWTLGANQSGKGAISAWRDLLLPAFSRNDDISLWPFEGAFRDLQRPGRITVAETYPADAMRQLGLSRIGSKRRQSDRRALATELRTVMLRCQVRVDDHLDGLLDHGFGGDSAGEDRFDCFIGVLCVIAVLQGTRPDQPPPDPWLARWEGWVLGQSWPHTGGA